MIIFGFGRRTIKSFGHITEQLCMNCNNIKNKDLLKVTTWFTLFFIPIIPYRIEYLMVCSICKNALKISKIDFEQVVKGNISVLQSGSIIGSSLNPEGYARMQVSEPLKDRYAGKTETQIAYLKQMEELENRNK